MWKKCLAFTAVLTLVILLDPSHTPAQPGGKGNKGFKGFGGKDGGNQPSFGSPGGMQPGAPGSPGGPSFGGRGRDGGKGGERPTYTFGPPGGTPGSTPGGERPSWGGTPGGERPSWGGPPPGGMQPGGMQPGGPGGSSRGSDPERGWQMLVRMTGSTGDTVDLSKIPPQTHSMLKGWAERTGALPLPESGIWTKSAYLDHHAKSEAAKAAFAANGGSNNSMSTSMDRGRDRDRDRGPGGFGDPNGGWGQGGWGQGGWERPSFEKKQVEEERPVAMRYGKLPQGLPSWYNELDTDKDGQVALYEWRKAAKDTKEFTEMDLNGDGLITADEYLRFARQKNIDTKVAAYEAGERGPGDWGIGEKLDTKSDTSSKSGNTKGTRGGWGFGPPKGDNSKSDNSKGSNDRKGNPWKR